MEDLTIQPPANPTQSKLNRPPYTPDRQMQAALERLPKRDKPRERLTGKEGPQGLQNRY